MIESGRNARVGILGGSFDPPHNGHLLVASKAAERLRLDRVILVPAALPPHKLGRQLSSPADRLAMCRLAAGENPLFGVSEIETKREGISFTVDTLGELKRTLPSGELFLLIGMDNYLEFHLWRDPEEILKLATIVVMDRPGYGLDEGGVPAESLIKRLDPGIKRVEVPLVDVSSTQVRRCVQQGRPISGLVPKAVEEYIVAHGLYR